jgi:hypothetical protein
MRDQNLIAIPEQFRRLTSTPSLRRAAPFLETFAQEGLDNAPAERFEGLTILPGAARSHRNLSAADLEFVGCDVDHS